MLELNSEPSLSSSSESSSGSSSDSETQQQTARTITFKAYYWSCEETEERELFIHVAGKDANNNSVQLRIDNFTPFVYLELPKRNNGRDISWNKTKCKAVFNYFQDRLKSEGPLDFGLCEKKILHYSRKVKTMFLKFPTYKATKFFKGICRRQKHFIAGAGSFGAGTLIVHEDNIDPVIKYSAFKDLKLAGWLDVKETIKEDEKDLTPEERKYSTANTDLYADWKDVNNSVDPPSADVLTPPKYMSFDIECYSKNHNSKLSDPTEPENVVYCITLIFGYLKNNDRKTIILTLQDPKDIPGTTTIRFNSEKELLLGFSKLVREENPDIFIGYNTIKFDWGYIIRRATDLGIYIKFAHIGRILGKRAELIERDWESSAYGKQEYKYFNCHGRVDVDVFTEIERNFKLPTYSLNAVSKLFLADEKDDIPYRQQFMIYQVFRDVSPLLTPEGNIKDIRKKILKIIPKHKTSGEVKKILKQIYKVNSISEIHDLLRDLFTLLTKYCAQDTLLPVKLVEKLNLWTVMEETSNVMGVPVSYIHTRGQQIKVLAQVYRQTIKNGIIIPSDPDVDPRKFQGATVIEANPGDYKKVGTLDFASLYPSVMIAHNICYTTLLRDDDPTPDEECHVLAWEDHVGCIHDPQKRKKKKEDVLCEIHRYRFKKVVFSFDSDGNIVRENEGLMPKLERTLLATRKVVKKEMAKLDATLKMQRGKADSDDIGYYKKMGWDIIKPGSLTDKQENILAIQVGILDAQQLAIKVSANSAYGILGARKGYIPLIQGAASVTAMGRFLINMAINDIREQWPSVKLVYGDTDSCMIHFRDANLEESFKLCIEAGKFATHNIKCHVMGVDKDFSVKDKTNNQEFRLNNISPKHPSYLNLSEADRLKVAEYSLSPIDLEFENMYGRFVLLTKKRYVAYSVNTANEIVKVTKKGVVLARRDNSNYLRLAYNKFITGILDEKPEEEIMGMIYDEVHKMFTRRVPNDHLVIYTGVKSVITYAKNKKIKLAGGKEQIVYLDEYKKPIDDPIGPLDPRLDYRNLPQALLALKMLRRGEEVPFNTRLEYLYLENDSATHQGEKAEDYTFFRENKTQLSLKVDQLHYIEKQLTKPVTELLGVKYPKERIFYEKMEEKLERLMKNDDLGKLITHRIQNTKKLDYPTPDKIDLGVEIGWSAMKGVCGKILTKKFRTDCYSSSTPREFTEIKGYSQKGVKGMMAKVQYILNSSKTIGPNEIDPIKFNELIDYCYTFKSRDIIDKLYKQKHVKKRPSRRAKQTGDKLKVNNEVMLWNDTHSHKKGQAGIIVGVTIEGVDRRLYDIQMFDDNQVIKKVQRQFIKTFTYKDGYIMKDILLYRKNYKKVVGALTNMFDVVEFESDSEESDNEETE